MTYIYTTENPEALACDGWCEHSRPVAMLDDDGYVYCGPCGERRRSGGRRVRKLRPFELNRLHRGKPVKSY